MAVNINGEVGPYFSTGQGVRQGDPISPFLFNLVVDALASILDLAKRAGHIRGICPRLVAHGGLTHLQYADDTIMMVEGSDEDIQNLKFLLLGYSQGGPQDKLCQERGNGLGIFSRGCPAYC